MFKLRQKCQALENTAQVEISLREQLGKMDVQIQSLLATSDDLNKQFVEVKSNCVNLTRNVRQLESAARATVELGFSKQDFVLGLLGVVDAALFHKKAWPQIDALVDELVTGYDTRKVPLQVEELVQQVHGKLQEKGQSSLAPAVLS